MRRKLFIPPAPFPKCFALHLLAGLCLLAGCPRDDDRTTPSGNISLDKKELTLSVGLTEKLTATLEPDNATQQELLWKSSNPEVAVVDDNGEISALKVGSTTITATVQGKGQWDICYVEVVNPSIVDFEPKEAAHSTTLTIHGEGFSTKTSETSVKLNGVPAKVTFAAQKEITVEVQKDTHCTGPERKCTGPVEVSVGGKTVDKASFTYTPTAIVSTLVGPNFVDSITGQPSWFGHTHHIAIDKDGNLYVPTNTHRIFKISPRGETSIFAGSSPDYADGSTEVARFQTPYGIAIHATTGDLYITESYPESLNSHRIRKISAQGRVSTLARDGRGFVENLESSAALLLIYPRSITIDRENNLYVVSRHRIHKLSPVGVGGIHINPVAGSDESGFGNGLGSDARFLEPNDIAIDAENNLYVADYANHLIRKLVPQGGLLHVSSFAGNRMQPGPADGPGLSAAQFHQPSGLTLDAAGNLYVADSNNRSIRKISPDGKVSTLAGSGTAGDADGIGRAAEFRRPVGIALNTQTGILYVTDENRIRKIVFE